MISKENFNSHCRSV